MAKDNNTMFMAAHGVSFACIAALGLFTYSQIEKFRKQVEEVTKRLDSIGDVTTDPVEKEKFMKAMTQLRDQMTTTNQSANGNFEQIKSTFSSLNRRIQELEAQLNTQKNTPKRKSPESIAAPSPIQDDE